MNEDQKIDLAKHLKKVEKRIMRKIWRRAERLSHDKALKEEMEQEILNTKKRR